MELFLNIFLVETTKKGHIQLYSALSPSSAEENQSRRIRKHGVKIMGEILEIASWVGTPVGGICAIAFVVAGYFYGRWVLTDPVKN
jgi:hypothetical protein